MPGLEMGRGAEEEEIMKELDASDGEQEVRAPMRKKRRGTGSVQSLLEKVVARQQRFFSDLLESIERKEQIREQIRQEREDKWRAEERAQQGVFNNALIALTRELVGDGVVGGLQSVPGLLLGANPPTPRRHEGQAKSRFRNWKRGEVLQLIKLRGEMDSHFVMAPPTARAGLWDELGGRLSAQGFRRNGKQCDEKWEKLVTLYKEMAEGKRDINETPYFHELSNVLRVPGTAA